MTMFVHREGPFNQMFYSAPEGVKDSSPGVTTDWGVPTLLLHEAIPDAVAARFSKRIRQDYVIVQEWSDVGICGNINIATPGVLRALCARLQCSPSEAVQIVRAFDERADPYFTVPEERQFSLARREPDRWVGHFAMHHKRRCLALNLMLDDPLTMQVPVPQIMGYGIEVAKRLERSITFYQDFPRTGAYVDLDMTVRGFIRHVDTAVKVALDSPQAITLTLKNGIFLTFENRRYSASVRGLEVQSSTGGSMFYRDMSLVPGSSNVVWNNRQVPHRKVAYEMIDRIARDIFVSWTYFDEVLADWRTAPDWLKRCQDLIAAEVARKVNARASA